MMMMTITTTTMNDDGEDDDDDQNYNVDDDYKCDSMIVISTKSCNDPNLGAFVSVSHNNINARFIKFTK